MPRSPGFGAGPGSPGRVKLEAGVGRPVGPGAQEQEPMKAGIACVAAALVLAGCNEEQDPIACAAYAVAGLGVTVTNADTGQPICDATVTAADGAYGERLFAVGCIYAGAYERAGTYVVRASRDGFAPKEVGPVHVVMGGGECPHVQETRVTVSLSPEK